VPKGESEGWVGEDKGERLSLNGSWNRVSVEVSHCMRSMLLLLSLAVLSSNCNFM